MEMFVIMPIMLMGGNVYYQVCSDRNEMKLSSNYMLIVFNIWRNFAETKMEIASGLREQFHSHTVSKQEKHHYDVVKSLIVAFLPFCCLISTGMSQMIRIY